MCLNPQSGQILCDPTDCSPPSSFVHGIFQVRMLEWVAVSYSGGSSQPRDLTHFHSFLSGFIPLTESHLIIGSQGFSPCRALQGLRAIVVAHEVCVKSPLLHGFRRSFLQPIPPLMCWHRLSFCPPVPPGECIIKTSPISGFSHSLSFRSPHVSSFSLKFKLCRAKSLQLCLTLCDATDHSPPGSSVHEILQARILEWVAISFYGESSQPRDRTHISYISCIGRQILYDCTTWEAKFRLPASKYLSLKAHSSPGKVLFLLPMNILLNLWQV